jgi:two-component system, chemotaxis family, protein-glutamate methylesterase/glutaminase
MTPELIVVGTSLGGLNALSALLGALPCDLRVPVVIVQHRGSGVDGGLARLLADRSRLTVVDAEDKMPLESCHAYLAPPDYHLMIEARGLLALSIDAPVRSARPSIDVLFESAAHVYGAAVIGVVLTGASADGADGLRCIKQRGGVVVVEDPATAECATMPSAALAATPVASVLPISRMAQYLSALADGGRD